MGRILGVSGGSDRTHGLETFRLFQQLLVWMGKYFVFNKWTSIFHSIFFLLLLYNPPHTVCKVLVSRKKRDRRGWLCFGEKEEKVIQATNIVEQQWVLRKE